MARANPTARTLALMAATLLAAPAGATADSGAVPAPAAKVEPPPAAPPVEPPPAPPEPALAPPEPAPAPTATPRPPPAYTLRPELQVGRGAPLGDVSASFVYGPREWLSLGAGIGTTADSLQDLHEGLFVRAHVLRFGALRLGPALTASRTDRRERSEVHGSEEVFWIWQPAYRLNLGVGIEARVGRFTARFEGGAGYVLNGPWECAYSSPSVPTVLTTCDAPEVPAQYRSASTAATVQPYLALSIGVDVQRGGPAAASGSATAPARRGWYGGPAVAADVAFLAVGGLGLILESETLVVLSAATYWVGAPANHAVHGRTGRAWGSVGLRAGGALLAAIAAVGAVRCIDQSNGCGTWLVLGALGPLAAMIIDDAYLARER